MYRNFVCTAAPAMVIRDTKMASWTIITISGAASDAKVSNMTTILWQPPKLLVRRKLASWQLLGFSISHTIPHIMLNNHGIIYPQYTKRPVEHVTVHKKLKTKEPINTIEYIAMVINSLSHRDATWRQRSGSTSAQVMACCLTAPSHFLNQCWLVNSEVRWYLPESEFKKFRRPWWPVANQRGSWTRPPCVLYVFEHINEKYSNPCSTHPHRGILTYQ